MSFKGQKEWRMALIALSAQKVYVPTFNNQNRVYMLSRHGSKVYLAWEIKKPKDISL